MHGRHTVIGMCHAIKAMGACLNHLAITGTAMPDAHAHSTTNRLVKHFQALVVLNRQNHAHNRIMSRLKIIPQNLNRRRRNSIKILRAPIIFVYKVAFNINADHFGSGNDTSGSSHACRQPLKNSQILLIGSTRCRGGEGRHTLPRYLSLPASNFIFVRT